MCADLFEGEAEFLADEEFTNGIRLSSYERCL